MIKPTANCLKSALPALFPIVAASEQGADRISTNVNLGGKQDFGDSKKVKLHQWGSVPAARDSQGKQPCGSRMRCRAHPSSEIPPKAQQHSCSSDVLGRADLPQLQNLDPRATARDFGALALLGQCLGFSNRFMTPFQHAWVGWLWHSPKWLFTDWGMP